MWQLVLTLYIMHALLWRLPLSPSSHPHHLSQLASAHHFRLRQRSLHMFAQWLALARRRRTLDAIGLRFIANQNARQSSAVFCAWRILRQQRLLAAVYASHRRLQSQRAEADAALMQLESSAAAADERARAQVRNWRCRFSGCKIFMAPPQNHW
jgi:hypothetical protein